MRNIALCSTGRNGIEIHAHHITIDEALQQIQLLWKELETLRAVRIDEDLSNTFMIAKKGTTVLGLLKQKWEDKL